MISEEPNDPLRNGRSDTEPGKSDEPWFTGRDQKRFHRVFVFKGQYKAYMGICHSVGNAAAWVQLVANGSKVEIPLSHLWNLYVLKLLCLHIVSNQFRTINAPFTPSTKWNEAMAKVDESYNIREANIPVRQQTPIYDSEDFHAHQSVPHESTHTSGKFISLTHLIYYRNLHPKIIGYETQKWQML